MRKLLPGWVKGFLCLWLVGMSLLTYAQNPLSGAYTINSANPASTTNFTSFQMAADSLSNNGVSGAVTITVAAGTYNEYVSFGYVAGASSTNTITIDGGDTATTSISNDGTVQNATIKIDSVQWFTITNLKVINTKTIDDAWGIQIMNESDNCTISNCAIEMGSISAFEDIVGIVANGSETASSTAGIFGDNLTITNNVIRDGYYGIRFESSLANDSNQVITSNHFKSNIGYGVYTDDLRVVTLTGNTVDGSGLTSKDGFYFIDVVDFDFQNNVANVLDYALYLSDANFDDVPSTRSKIINNMFNGTGDEGVYMDDVETFDFYHNTVRGAGSTTAYGIRLNDVVDVVFRNNIFYSEQSYAFYSVDDLNGSADADYDYNVYYTGGATIAYISSSNQYADLAAWQAGDATSNVSSVSGDPTFMGSTNLHVTGAVANDVGDNAVGVTTDIDGDSRPISGSTVVDIGADEFTPPTCQLPTALGATAITSSSADVFWTTGGATDWVVEYGVSGFTQGAGTMMASTNDTLSLSSLTSQTTYQFYVKDSCSAIDVSPWAGPYSFTTACAPFTAPYSESFDNTSTPACWSQSATSGGPWLFTGTTNSSFCSAASDHTGNAGSFAWMDQSTTDVGVVLEMGDVDVSSLTTPYLDIWYWMCGAGYTPANITYIETWDGSAWMGLDTLDFGTSGWENYGFDLTGHTYGANLVRVRFRAESGGSTSDFYGDNALDDISILEAPACFLPSALGATAITSSSADIFWTTGGATDWVVEYGVSGFTQGAGTMMAATNDTISLSSLMASTSYDFYVKDSCTSTSTSLWAGPYTFATACAAFAAPYTESFDGSSTPLCWSQSATTGGPWLFSGSTNSVNCSAASDHTGNAGSYAWMDQSGTDAGVILEMGDVDVSTLTVPYLDMWYWMCGVGYTPLNSTVIESWDGSAWNTLATLSAATSGWENFGFVLTGHTYGSNLVRLRFRAESGGSGSDFLGDNALDDISIVEAPPCPDPANLGATNITSSTADVFWTTGGATMWNIEYGTTGFTPGSGTMMNVTNDTVTISSLSPLTFYDFYVQDTCSATDVSNWVGPYTFNTIGLPCPASESVPFYENFDVSEGCFDTTDAGGAAGDSWAHTVNASQNLDGTGYMRVDSDANGNGVQLIETLESPIIDASTVSNQLVLEFDHYYRNSGDSVVIAVYDGANWVNVLSYNSTVGSWGNPQHEVLDVSAYANANFQVRFIYDDNNNWAWYWSVDNFSVEDKCLTQSLPYTENFDVDQGCFIANDGGGATGDTWAHNTSATQNLDGTGYMRVDSDVDGNGTHLIEGLESPVIDASGVTGSLLLEFDHFFRSVFAGDSAEVLVYDGTTWVSVASFTSTVGAFGAPDQQAIDITAYANANLQVRFNYDDNNQWAWYWSVDNFSVSQVGCLAPSGLSLLSASADSATVYWTGGGGATNWNIQYDTAGFALGTGNMISATNDTAGIGGLMANTTYEVYVQDSCSATSVSSWFGPLSFTTSCAAFVAPYTESFDNTTMPNCWSQSAVSGGPWLFAGSANSVNCAAPADHTGNGGNYTWMDQSGGDGTVVLEMPDVDVSALTTPYLELYYWMCGVGYTPTNLTIIETWDGSAWSHLDTLDQPTSGWESFGYDLTGRTYGSNLIRVRFIAESGGSTSDFFGDNSLDDISIIEAPSCSDPSNLGATNITTTTADIFWTTGGATNWNIEIGLSGFAPGSGIMAAVANDTVPLINLTPLTFYDFYVQDSCGAGDVSNWIGPFTFNTLGLPCPAVESLPFFENFDVNEGCFDTIDAGGASGDSWAHTVNASQNLDGTGYMRVDSDANGNGILLDETLESPVIDASVVSNSLILEFDHYYRAIGGDTGAVEVYDGAGWIEVASYSSDVGAFGAPAREVIDVTMYANANFQVRFNYNDGNVWAWYWSVDNFSVEDKCVTQSLPYVENFDVDAGCFTTIDGGGATGDSWTQTVNATQNLDGTGYMRVDSDLNGNGVHLVETLMSPEIDASSITGTLMLTFDHYYRTIVGDTGWVDVFDGTNWVNLALFTTDVGAFGTPDQQAIDISAYANANLQVRFHYDDANQWAWYWSVDNFSVAEVGCVAPSALGVDTTSLTTADVFWTSGGASNWNVEYGPVGFTPGTGTMLSATNDSIQITGLMASSCYDMYVQDSCGPGDVSTFTGPFTFCTLCGPVAAPYYESFDLPGIANCWSTFNTSGSTAGNSFWRGTDVAWPAYAASGIVDHTGNGGYAQGVDGSSTAAGDTAIILETPEIDMSALTTPELVFWMFQNNISTADNMHLSIDLYDGTNWIDSIFGYSQNSTTWVELRVDLSSYTFTGNAKLRFEVDKVVGGAEPFRSDIIIDDVSIDEKPACLDPSNASITGQTTTSVDVGWTSDTNIVTSIVEYGLSGFTPGTGTTVNTTPGSISATGLMPGTCYDFYIQDSCSTLTNWIGPIIGCTQAICNVTTTPTLVGDTGVCGGGPITLTGTAGSGDIAWMLNGQILATGSSYSDSIGGTTIYEGADYSVVGPAVHVGPLSTIATTGFGNFSNGQWFTVLDTISIDSTTVTANGFVEGRVVISDDAGGNVIQVGETFQTGATAGDYQVPIGVILTPGSYFMNVEFDITTTGQLFRATGGAIYPYVLPGLMTIDSVNFAGARYYYTFDLVVSGACLGTAVPVTALVPGPNSGSSDSVGVCETDTVDLTSFLGSHDAGGTWIDVDSSMALSGNMFNASLADTGSYYNFIYALPSSGGCSGDSATITVLVDYQPNAGVDAFDTLCTSVTTLTAIDPLLGINDGGGSWTDLDSSGALLGNRVRPSNAVSTGTFRYRYTIASNGACPSSSAIVTITFEDEVNAGMDASDSICDSISSVDLNAYLDTSSTTGGYWVDMDATGALTGATFNPSAVADGASYDFAYVVASAGCGNDTAIVTIYVEDCIIGLDEQAFKSLDVYPNPTEGQFHIETRGIATKDMHVEIYSLNGKLLYSNTFEGYNSRIKLDVSDYARGVYNVKIRTEKGVEVHKITRQ